MVKTVILAPDCQLSDAALMQENETIANPTNKKLKNEVTPRIKDSSIPSSTIFMDKNVIVEDDVPIECIDKVKDEEEE